VEKGFETLCVFWRVNQKSDFGVVVVKSEKSDFDVFVDLAAVE